MFLQFRNGVICMIYDRDNREVVEPMRDVSHLVETLVALRDDGSRVGCSSTLDFPEEYTNDPAQIALAKELRG